MEIKAKIVMLKGEKGEQGDVNLAQLNAETTARENADTNLQNQINGLASGSPLVASSTSGMTDTSRIYVNTTDGHWYWYDGTTWQDGGIYQGSFVDKSDPIYEKLKNTINLENIILSNLIEGYINNRKIITPDTRFHYTQPIPLKAGETIFVNCKSINSGVSVISWVLQNGTIMQPFVLGIDGTTRLYEYTTDNDIYVVVSLLKDDTPVIYKGIKTNYLLNKYLEAKKIHGVNYIDGYDTTDGFYYDVTGSIAMQSGFCYNNKLYEIENNTNYKIILPNASVFIVYYNQSFEYLSGEVINNATLNVPANAKYIRLSYAIAYKGNIMLTKSNYNGGYKEYVSGYDKSNILNFYSDIVNYKKINVGVGENYTTINDALNSITDNDYYNRYIIFIKKGEYNETINCKDYVDLIGEDKYKSIINYTPTLSDDYADKSTIFATVTCNIENLTIKTTNTKYPIHSDGGYNTEYKLKIKNCYIQHNGFTDVPTRAGTGIGIGLYEKQHILIDNCEVIGTTGIFGASDIYCHNQGGNNDGYRSIIIKNTTLGATTYGFRLEAIEPASVSQNQKNDARLINVINNATTPIRNTHISADSWNLIEY